MRPPDKFRPWFSSWAPADAASPYEFDEVYIWREGDDQPRKVDPRFLPQAMNVHGLFWRPVLEDEPDLSVKH